MSEISKNKNKNSLINEKIRKDIYGKIKNNNSINKYLFNEHIIIKGKHEKLSKSIKQNNLIQSKSITKIAFFLKLLIFINLYFNKVSSNQEIIIKIRFKESDKDYKILNHKYSKCPSNIYIYDENDSRLLSLTFSTNCDYSNTKISQDGYSLFYKFISTSTPKIYKFKFSWNINDEQISFKELFKDCINIEFVDLALLTTEGITDMESMFEGCTNLSIVNTTNLKTSNVVSMKSMFKSCVSLTALDVSKFDTSKVNNMETMFSNCQKIRVLDISNFKVEKVTSMRAVFEYCSSLTTLNLYEFMTIRVTDMSFMFYECSNLKSIDVSSFYVLWMQIFNISNFIYNFVFYSY